MTQAKYVVNATNMDDEYESANFVIYRLIDGNKPPSAHNVYNPMYISDTVLGYEGSDEEAPAFVKVMKYFDENYFDEGEAEFFLPKDSSTDDFNKHLAFLEKMGIRDVSEEAQHWYKELGYEDMPTIPEELYYT